MVLEMRKYALHYIIYDMTLTQDKDQSSVKKKTDDQRLAVRCVTAALKDWPWANSRIGSREHLLQKSSKRPIIEFRFGISSSLPRFDLTLWTQ